MLEDLYIGTTTSGLTSGNTTVPSLLLLLELRQHHYVVEALTATAYMARLIIQPTPCTHQKDNSYNMVNCTLLKEMKLLPPE